MARVKLQIPSTFSFTTQIAVRITDVNYGGHLGNDAMLSLIHEARMQYLGQFGYTELSLAGVSLIMSDAAIEFKSEAFYADVLQVQVTVGEFSRSGFELFYRFTKTAGGKEIVVALAKTGMVCYDYNAKKISPVPEEVKQSFLG